DHESADNYFGIKQFVRKFNIKILKTALRTWQQGLYGKAWNATYFENHDQARIVGRYCSDKVHRIEGAKMMASILLTLSGTPFIYEGQEIGSTSIRMPNIDTYQDVESKRSYVTARKIFGKRGAMKRIAYSSRDNARTPVQWNNTLNAGFSSAEKTWLPVNPNYVTVNIENDLKNENSVLNYYKSLIALRKVHKQMIYGTYTDYYVNSKALLVYKREYEGKKLLIVNNFSLKDIKFNVPKELLADKYTLLTSNYASVTPTLCDKTLSPYESSIYIAE
ncbi:MAG: alpha-amylase family glycosyl hydrolase, partial [Clostridia bacterium]